MSNAYFGEYDLNDELRRDPLGSNQEEADARAQGLADAHRVVVRVYQQPDDGDSVAAQDLVGEKHPR